ncbi:MAG: hypothetical protein K0S33_1745 [Bacteroidetes bacterium]|nr:hypothetical protein [Bacteroidota bacterium]
MSEDDLLHIGKGWSFPPAFNKASKGVERREGNNDIVESLQILLTTLPGERIYDGAYGCDLTPLLFEPFTVSLKTRLTDKIKNAVALYEPRVDLENVEFNLMLEEGIMYIALVYKIRSNNSRFNMVFPFYLKEGTEL